jgi:uncharacterized protein (DUF488 family)
MAAFGIYTIGHSNRTIEEFLRILKVHGIECVADVRTIPRSRHNPQFNADALKKSLKKAKILYAPLPKLGGLRKPRKDSRNLAWRNASFRGFADYMEAPEFEEGLGELLSLSGKKKTAMMCAEAVPWQCHRSLIADTLLARGIVAFHIFDHRKLEPHRLTPFGRIENDRVVYPAEQTSLL